MGIFNVMITQNRRFSTVSVGISDPTIFSSSLVGIIILIDYYKVS